MKKLLLYLFIGFLFYITAPSQVYAHRPHDPIGDIKISPAFATDHTAFVIVADKLKRSTDGGESWKWLNWGLDYVYPLASIAISPSFGVDKTIFVSSKGDGVYRSQDGGNSWRKINSGLDDLRIKLLVISPQFDLDRSIVACDVLGNLYESRNQGESWKRIYHETKEISAIAYIPFESGLYLMIGDAGGSLYLLSGQQVKKMGFDRGCGAITAIVPSHKFVDNKTIWIGTETCGILKSRDEGKTFSEANQGLPEKKITSILVATQPSGEETLYVSAWHKALFQSDDGGGSWTELARGLTTDPQADDPGFYLPYFKGIAATGGTLFLGGFDGLFKSDDGGQLWYQLETWPLSYISVLTLSPVDRQQYAAFLAYGGGAYLVPDAARGASWIDSARSLTLAGKKGVRTDSGISDVLFSPNYNSDGTIFASGEHELMKSVDKGGNWKRVKVKLPMLLGLRKRINRYMYKVGVPENIRRKIVGFFPLIPGWSTYIALSPGFKTDGTVFFGTQGVGLCKSVDWGESCSVVYSDSAGVLTNSLLVSPDFSHDKSLFIGIRESGIYKTVDGGKSFKKMNSGINPVGNIWLSLSPDYQKDGIALAGTGEGLFVTNDGGKHWSRAGGQALSGKANILDVAVSPAFPTDRTVMVAVKGRGIFKSTDGGVSFSEIGKELIRNNYQIKKIRFSKQYAHDSTVYGVSAEEVFRTRDGGLSWQIIPRPVRYEDVRDMILYRGSWTLIKGGTYSDSTETRSKTPGDRATLRFLGTGISFIGEQSPDSGCAKVYIDGKFVKELSLQSKDRKTQVTLFSSSRLSNGAHQIMIEVCASKQPHGWVSIDAFEVIP